MPNISNFCENIGCACANPGPEGPVGPPGPMSPGAGQIQQSTIRKGIDGLTGGPSLVIPFSHTFVHPNPNAIAIGGGITDPEYLPGSDTGFSPSDLVVVTKSRAVRNTAVANPDDIDPLQINIWKVEGTWQRPNHDSSRYFFAVWAAFWVPSS